MMATATTQKAASSTVQPLPHDGVVHHPLGGGSYLFDGPLIPYTLSFSDAVDPSRSLVTEVHCGVQPNNSPHLGTQSTIMLAFHTALAIRKATEGTVERKVKVVLDLVDTAPTPGDLHDAELEIVPDGYQRSLRDNGRMTKRGDPFTHGYKDLMLLISSFAPSTPYEIRTQNDLNRSPNTPRIVQQIVQHREELGKIMCPKRARLCLRAACPVDHCGLTDKHAQHNDYSVPDRVTFACPKHGTHSIDLFDPEQVARLEYNTPLRNLVRSFVFALDERACHVRVTGADYTGSYQQVQDHAFSYLESFLRRASSTPLRPPWTLYSPLVVDWAGSKLSKSLYVDRGAYGHLAEQGSDWVLSFERMLEKGKDPRVLWEQVGRWVQDPKKLFRSYSIEYFLRVFAEEEGTVKRDGGGALAEPSTEKPTKSSSCVVA